MLAKLGLRGKFNGENHGLDYGHTLCEHCVLWKMEIRHYKPGDAEAVAELWNARVSGCFSTGPLTAERFAVDVAGKVYFEPEGCILAFAREKPVAFAHAGFKSSDWIHPDFRLGTISMVAVAEDRIEAGEAAVAAAIRYLARRGARQIEAFTIDFANTPFYNGLYGGEKAGMDEAHPLGVELMRRCHFNITSAALIMVCDLNDAGARYDAPPGLRFNVGPWESPLRRHSPSECYGIPEPLRRAQWLDGGGHEKAGVTFWHLERHNRATGERLAVVSHVGAAPELHGTGAALALQSEVHRILRQEGAARMGLGTGAANGRAVHFYQKLGYRPLKAAYTFHLDWRHYPENARR